MKKKLLTLALAGILSIATLFGGCGFGGSDDKIIDKINPVHNAEKGVTEITITYVDNLYDPDYFEIPDGKQGAIGYTGNGIEEIQTIEKPEGDQIQRYMLITYTDGNVIEFPIYDGTNGKDGTDGKDGKSIDYIQPESNPDGSVSIVVHFSDGTKSESIPVPGGKNGDKITVSSSLPDEETGKITVTFTVTDHWNTSKEHTLTIDKGEKGDSIEYIIGSTSEDGKVYTLKIKIENDDELKEISFNRPPAMLSGSRKPVDDEGEGENKIYGDGLDGDMYYHLTEQAFYRKDNGVWTLIFSLNKDPETYKITFQAFTWINDEQIPVEVDPNNVFSGLKQGTFSSNGRAGKVPMAILPIEYQASYQFVGWYTTTEPNFITQSPFTDLTYIASDMTLYPIFVAI